MADLMIEAAMTVFPLPVAACNSGLLCPEAIEFLSFSIASIWYGLRFMLLVIMCFYRNNHIVSFLSHIADLLPRGDIPDIHHILLLFQSLHNHHNFLIHPDHHIDCYPDIFQKKNTKHNLIHHMNRKEYICMPYPSSVNFQA